MKFSNFCSSWFFSSHFHRKYCFFVIPDIMIDIQSYRQCIGNAVLINAAACGRRKYHQNDSFRKLSLRSAAVIMMLLIMAGIESNPGPVFKTNKDQKGKKKYLWIHYNSHYE